jgi:hypothetical protein
MSKSIRTRTTDPAPEDRDEDREETPAILMPTPTGPRGPVAKRGLGHRPDAPDPRDFKVRALFGAPRGMPAESSLEEHVLKIADQGETSSCVGQAIGCAVDTRLRKMGRVVQPVSRQAIYTFGRAIDRASPTEALRDEGSYPRLAMRGMKQWGVPTAHRWPFDPAHINDEMPWDVMQESSAFTLSAWWRVSSVGNSRVEEVCQALSHGYPVVFGTEVDAAFCDHTGKGRVTPADPRKSLGGHMMCLVGYRTEGATRVFRGVNSWGTSWGDGGFYNAGPEFVMDARATDFYVIQIN